MDELLFIVDNNERRSDVLHRQEMTQWLKEKGYQVRVFEDGELCINSLEENPSAIFLDINVPGMAGLEILKRLRLANRDIPVIVVTDNTALDSAVEAMKMGAFDYMVKPVDKIRLHTNVERAIEMFTMTHKIERLQGELKNTYAFKQIIGQSEAMRQVFAHIEKVASININVFIQGASGTGKELVAKAIHYTSPYKEGNFVAINCGAIPESLQESEFFGYEKGAFTGADEARSGKLENADGGTLFLDEVGEMTPGMQVKLLRFLQEKTFERVGGHKKYHVDLRVVSATNKDLEKFVDQGKFREDLYYRLVVYPIVLPSLRKRKEDIPLLVNHFLKKYKDEMPKTITTVSSCAMEALMRYEWRGNVREIENVIYRAMVSTRSDTIQIEHLPVEIQGLRLPEIKESAPHEEIIENVENLAPPIFHAPEVPSPPANIDPLKPLSIVDLEKQALMDALKRNNGKISQTARELGISRATIYRRIKQYRSA